MGWYNSNFGYVHHIAKRCGTADEAYRVVEGCLQNREMALREATHGRKKRDLERLKLTNQLRGATTELEVAEVELELEALSLHTEVEEENYRQCEQEVAFIKSLLASLLPHCEYVGKIADKDEAYQLAQRKEWFVKNVRAAHNQLLTHRTIDIQLLEQIQIHPDAALLTDIVDQLSVEARNGTLSVNTVTKYIPDVPLPTFLPSVSTKTLTAPEGE